MTDKILIMFFRSKRSDAKNYLQLVENQRDNGQIRQRVIATVGRLDRLQAAGQLDDLLLSGARFSGTLLALPARDSGAALSVSTRRIGPVIIFERLWLETGCWTVIKSLLRKRRKTFPIERAVFLRVVHELCAPGSPQTAHRWRRDYAIAGVEELQPAHLQQAMAWLGIPLRVRAAMGTRPLRGRRMKDTVEETLFASGQEPPGTLELAFLAITAIRLQGSKSDIWEPNEAALSQHPGQPQLVVGVAFDKTGRPFCCELWPDEEMDLDYLAAAVDRLQQRFAVRQVCILADPGLIDPHALAVRGWPYILLAPRQDQTEAPSIVLSRAGRYRLVTPPGPDTRSVFKVKDVHVADRRYVVCFDEALADTDATERQALAQALAEQLQQGNRPPTNHPVYGKYLKTEGETIVLDEVKLAQASRLDGKRALRTNTTLDAVEVAQQYRRLGVVKAAFSSLSSLGAATARRRHDDELYGHVFCTFLALLLRYELQTRLANQGHYSPWHELIADLNELQEIEIDYQQKRFLLLTAMKGSCSQILQTLTVPLPPAVQTLPGAAPGSQ